MDIFESTPEESSALAFRVFQFIDEISNQGFRREPSIQGSRERPESHVSIQTSPQPSQKFSSKREIFVPSTTIFPSIDEILATSFPPIPPSSPRKQGERFAPPITIFPSIDQILAGSPPPTPPPSPKKQSSLVPPTTIYPGIDGFFATSLQPTDLPATPETPPKTPESEVCETNSISDSDGLDKATMRVFRALISNPPQAFNGDATTNSLRHDVDGKFRLRPSTFLDS